MRKSRRGQALASNEKDDVGECSFHLNYECRALSHRCQSSDQRCPNCPNVFHLACFRASKSAIKSKEGIPMCWACLTQYKGGGKQKSKRPKLKQEEQEEQEEQVEQVATLAPLPERKPGKSSGTPGVSAYEAQRIARIAKNQAFMKTLGLDTINQEIMAAEHAAKSAKRKAASQRGIARAARARKRQDVGPPRKSSRLSGAKPSGFYVESELNGKITISANGIVTSLEAEEEEAQMYPHRVNEGQPIPAEPINLVKEEKKAVDDGARVIGKGVKLENGELVEVKEEPAAVKEEKGEEEVVEVVLSEEASALVTQLKGLSKDLDASLQASPSKKRKKSTSSSKTLEERLSALSINEENQVAKVVPGRIYSMAAHPSSACLLVAAGDKNGHVGLWDVNAKDHVSDGVYLFKPHGSPITHLEWSTNGDSLLSVSYDGTVRNMNLETESFEEVFAAYQSEDTEREKYPGYGVDHGINSWWTQYGCMDPHNKNGLYLTSSKGEALHVDMRCGKHGKLSWKLALHDKKINTLSVSSDGYTCATAGLDCVVKVWDLRRMGDKCKPVASMYSKKSVNSAFFSPSGDNLLSTTMCNNLNLYHKPGLGLGQKPTLAIRHDNHTGRWLSTFMARWHPTCDEDIFVVGSMEKPRCIELFSANGQGTPRYGKRIVQFRGETLASVASRCCFHPTADAVFGGNSSGRVYVVR